MSGFHFPVFVYSVFLSTSTGSLPRHHAPNDQFSKLNHNSNNNDNDAIKKQVRTIPAPNPWAASPSRENSGKKNRTFDLI